MRSSTWRARFELLSKQSQFLITLLYYLTTSSPLRPALPLRVVYLMSIMTMLVNAFLPYLTT